MGFYINPPGDKLDWLIDNGRPISNLAEILLSDQLESGPVTFRKGDDVACCLISNGTFDALGVAFDQQELEAFRRPDGRPKMWAWVPITLAEEMSGVRVAA